MYYIFSYFINIYRYFLYHVCFMSNISERTRVMDKVFNLFSLLFFLTFF